MSKGSTTFTGIPGENLVDRKTDILPRSTSASLSGETITRPSSVGSNGKAVSLSSILPTASGDSSRDQTERLAVQGPSPRQELLKRRVTTLADYFAPLVKSTAKQTTNIHDITCDTDMVSNYVAKTDEKNNATGSICEPCSQHSPNEATLSNPKVVNDTPCNTPTTTTEHDMIIDDDLHQTTKPTKENRAFLQAIRQKICTIFKRDQQPKPRSYLDGYKRIARTDLKIVVNSDSNEPIFLGSGSYGAVTLMSLSQGGEEVLVAVKSFRQRSKFASKNNYYQKIAKEVKFLDTMQDVEEFPKVYGVCKNRNSYHIVMEFIGKEKSKESIDLAEAIAEEILCGFPHRSVTSDLLWLEVFLDTIKAIHQMHDRGILHCDIAPRNVMLYNNGQRVAGKLIDFGLACSEDKPRWLPLGKLKTKAAARHLLEQDSFFAPEFCKGTWLNRGGRFSRETDIWMFGKMLDCASELLTWQTKADLQNLIADCTSSDPQRRALTKHIQSELESAISRICVNHLGF